MRGSSRFSNIFVYHEYCTFQKFEEKILKSKEHKTVSTRCSELNTMFVIFEKGNCKREVIDKKINSKKSNKILRF